MNVRSFSRVCAVMLFILLLWSAAGATITFKKPNSLGEWMTELSGTGQPKWEIVRDDTAPSLPFVLKQSGWSPNPSYPLCIKNGSVLTNGYVEVGFKPISGTNDQAAGVVWRYQNCKNYYVARANAVEGNVVLYKVQDGKRTSLDIVGRKGGYGVKADVLANRWSILRVEFTDERFRTFLNGRQLFAVEDSTFATAGAVGVWTKADSITMFDDFSYGSK